MELFAQRCPLVPGINLKRECHTILISSAAYIRRLEEARKSRHLHNSNIAEVTAATRYRREIFSHFAFQRIFLNEARFTVGRGIYIDIYNLHYL